MNENGSTSQQVIGEQDQAQPVGFLNNPQFLSWIFLFLAGGVLAVGYVLGDFWYAIPVVFVIIIAQIISDIRHWYWVASLVFLIFTVLVAGGFYLEIESPLLLMGLVFALFTWDLSSFDRRIQEAGRIVLRNKQVAKHLTRLLITGSAGLILAFVALSFEIQLEFGWLVLLGLITFFGLSYIITKLLKTS